MSVTIERWSGTATVTVDNPPVNALDDPTLIGLHQAAQDLGADRDVRSVILTGTGTRAFIAGADLRTLCRALGPDGVPGEMDHHVSLTGPAFRAWSELPQPVVAAVQANALGGGLEFALCCDLIVSDPRAKFGLPEVTLGLMPGGGGTQRLPMRIGLAATLELVLLGRVITAERAQELGLVHTVTEEGAVLEQAKSLASRLASLPAAALQSAKRAIRGAGERATAEGLALERQLFLEVAASADAREGASAFLDKRSPVFGHH